MQSARYGDHYVLRLDEGEQAVATLRSFLVQHGVLGGYFLAWGGFSRLTLKYYGIEEHTFYERDLERQVEVVSLLGNIACMDGEPVIHAHMTVGDANYATYSGHLGEGTVRPMLEVFVTAFPGALRRVWDAARGLAVLQLERMGEEEFLPAAGGLCGQRAQ